MKRLILRRGLQGFLLLLTLLLLSACIFKFGDTDAINEASELAIDCKTEEALATLDRASQSGGLSASIADLLRVSVLRDAGRDQEADAAMADRNKRWNVDAQSADDDEKAIAETVEKIRSERQQRTGKRTCD